MDTYCISYCWCSYDANRRKLSDIYGRKKMVLIIMVIYIIGMSLGGFSSNIAFLIVSRVIQGIGIAMFPIAFGIVRDQFPPEKLAIGII
jgi:MFS family permease